MDLTKIGSFIAKRRKLKGLTQSQLAERLGVTDRAISKWECGRSMPDSSIMLDLCNELEISVNELLTGEELEMQDYNKQAEDNLIEMAKQKEASDKRLLILGSSWDKHIADELHADLLIISVPVQHRLVMNCGYLGYEGGLRAIEDIYDRVLATYR